MTQDSKVQELLKRELLRQEEQIGLIASENYVSKAVLQATGSVFTNKYSEGYPRKRYYAGNEVIDDMEELAIERAKQLFGAEHVNVQPYSGSPGNLEIYFGLLKEGDTIMSLDLAQGGHLTHGSPVNFTGKTYRFVHYGLDPETETIDYDAVQELAQKEQPKLILSGFTAYPRQVDFKRMAGIAASVNAYSMADISHIAGLIVAGVHQSPFPETDVVMTTTHKTLRGPRGAMIMCKANLAQAIDKAVFPGMQGGPHNHTNLAKAVAFGEALQPEFKEYGRQIVRNAKALAEALRQKGFRLVSGGTDTHLILLDLTPKQVTGKQAQLGLEKAGIIQNMNMIPYDKRKPFDPSGLRLGTAQVTTRGMKEQEMQQIAEFIDRGIQHVEDEHYLSALRKEVRDFATKFPIYAT